MIRVIYMRGLTDDEYTDLKAAIKVAGIPASVRKHSQARTHRFVDIRPTAATGHRWTEEDATTVKKIVAAHDLHDNTPEILNGPNWYYCYRSGFNYLYKELQS